MKPILLAVFCVIVCGCPIPPECDSSLSYPYWMEWANGKLISIVDDSLAILTSQRYKKECKSGEEYIIGSRSGLFLVNYRTKQKPLSIDTTPEIIFTRKFQIDYYDRLVGDPYYNNPYFNVVENYFRDSSVLIIDNENKKFGFWKIGTEYVSFEKYFYQESYDIDKANPWINENILFKNSKKLGRNGETWDTAPMLNMRNGQISMFDFSGGYEWLNECLDVSYIGGKILCIKIKDAETNKFKLVADGVDKDIFQVIFKTCDKDENENYRIVDCYNYAVALDGNYIIKEIIFPLWITNGSINEVYKIDTGLFKLSNTFVPVWIYYDFNGVRFYNNYNFDSIDNIDNPANFIQYTPNDLFGASN